MNPTYENAYVLTKRGTLEEHFKNKIWNNLLFFLTNTNIHEISVNQAHSDILTRLNFEGEKFQNDKISIDTSKGKF